MTPKQDYDTETLKRELGRLGYDGRAHEGSGLLMIRLPLGNMVSHLMNGYRVTWPRPRDGWLAALEHARRSKSLTGAKIAAFGPRTGLSGMKLTYDQTDMEWTANHGRDFFGIGHTPDEAINALWESVCLRGRT